MSSAAGVIAVKVSSESGNKVCIVMIDLFLRLLKLSFQVMRVLTCDCTYPD